MSRRRVDGAFRGRREEVETRSETLSRAADRRADRRARHRVVRDNAMRIDGACRANPQHIADERSTTGPMPDSGVDSCHDHFVEAARLFFDEARDLPSDASPQAAVKTTARCRQKPTIETTMTSGMPSCAISSTASVDHHRIAAAAHAGDRRPPAARGATIAPDALEDGRSLDLSVINDPFGSTA